MSKVKFARGIVAGWLIGQYYREMKENYRKGDWLEAGKDTAFFVVAMGPVVAPALFWRAAAPVVIAGAAVVGTTMAIVEITGVGEWEDVVELMYDPPTYTEFRDVVGPAIEQEILVPFAEAYVGWVDRRIAEFELVWSLTRPQSLW